MAVSRRCTAIESVFSARSRAEEAIARLAAAAAALRLGMPWVEDLRITPLPEDGTRARFGNLVDEAPAGGAVVRTPGAGATEHELLRPAVVYPARPSRRSRTVE